MNTQYNLFLKADRKASCGQLMGWMQKAAPRLISLENQEEVKQ